MKTGRLGGRHGVAAAGLALLGVVALAVPALAHASFPAYSAFGFAPNTQGGTGAEGSTPPYPANTATTIYLRAPFEQTEQYNGSDDTTVEVKAVVPDGWTNPTCGAAKTQVKSEATNNTNQPGADVAGWSCETYVSAGHTVIRWWGPQVTAPATATDSAQFFVFGITTPSPLAQTTYNGTAGTEGFIVDQTYASGASVHWIPDASFPGTIPPGAESVVASGLARTVAAFDPSSTTTSTTASTTTTVGAGAADPVAVEPAFTG